MLMNIFQHVMLRMNELISQQIRESGHIFHFIPSYRAENIRWSGIIMKQAGVCSGHFAYNNVQSAGKDNFIGVEL